MLVLHYDLRLTAEEALSYYEMRHYLPGKEYNTTP